MHLPTHACVCAFVCVYMCVCVCERVCACCPSGKCIWGAIESRFPTLINYNKVHAESICVFIIFNVRIHTGVGHTNKSVQHFDSEKLLQIFLVLLTGFEHRVFGSRVRCSTNCAIPSPHLTP